MVESGKETVGSLSKYDGDIPVGKYIKFTISSSGNVTEVTSGYPDEWTMTENCCDDLNYVAGSYKKNIYSMNPTCNNHTPWFVGTASGSTGGNPIATIYVTQLSSGSEIIANGTSITSTGTYNIDVSKTSTLNLTARLKGNMFINSIYFHN